jgi:hypothetical protein
MSPTRSVALALGTCALLAFGLGAAEKSPQRDGRQLFKDTCKSCHLPDSPNGEYTPMSLIQDQWREFFDHQLVPAHEKLTDPAHDGRRVLDLLTTEEMKQLRDWTIDHAADSENPMTCG